MTILYIIEYLESLDSDRLLLEFSVLHRIATDKLMPPDGRIKEEVSGKIDLVLSLIDKKKEKTQ